jgi:hypothetical protein
MWENENIAMKKERRFPNALRDIPDRIVLVR